MIPFDAGSSGQPFKSPKQAKKNLLLGGQRRSFFNISMRFESARGPLPSGHA
jgi:hypothetical protein